MRDFLLFWIAMALTVIAERLPLIVHAIEGLNR